MTRAFYTILSLLMLLSCVACGPLILHAQSLPITKTLVWDPNPASEQVTHYVVALDGTAIGSPTATSQSVTFTTAGPHTLSVSAVNLWGTSPPTTLKLVIVIPASPGNLRLQ